MARTYKQTLREVPATEETQEALVTDYAEGPDLLSVDATVNGKSLADLLGRALNSSLKKIVLKVESGVVMWAAGNASAASPGLDNGIELRVTKVQADTFRFFSAAGATMSLIQEV